MKVQKVIAVIFSPKIQANKRKSVFDSLVEINPESAWENKENLEGDELKRTFSDCESCTSIGVEVTSFFVSVTANNVEDLKRVLRSKFIRLYGAWIINPGEANFVDTSLFPDRYILIDNPDSCAHSLLNGFRNKHIKVSATGAV